CIGSRPRNAESKPPPLRPDFAGCEEINCWLAPVAQPDRSATTSAIPHLARSRFMATPSAATPSQYLIDTEGRAAPGRFSLACLTIGTDETNHPDKPRLKRRERNYNSSNRHSRSDCL